MGQWNDYAFSINDYIGSDYVQVRIRFEGSGKGVTTTDAKVMAIDNLCINFSHDAVNEHFVNKRFNFLVSPNPTNGIVNITTESEGNYLIAVYNMLGVKMLSKESFSDGILDLSSFPQGIYFISVDNGVDRITKRIVISK